MKRSFRAALGIGCVTALGLLGCGGEPAPTSGAAGSGGSAQAGGQSQSGGGSGGSAGAPAGGTGQGGVKPLDCSGAFAAPALAMVDEGGVRLGSPTFSPDGLELIYSREVRDESAAPTMGFRRSTRSSVDEQFPVGTPLPSLDVACAVDESRSADLSADGLRAYIVCYPSLMVPVGPGTLRIADRPSLTGEFTVRPESLPVGPSAAISADELTLYTTSDVDTHGYPPRQFRRSSTSEMFGAGSDIPGLESTYLLAPDISPDGLSLYGGLEGGVVVAVRPSIDAPFAAPTTLYPRPEGNAALGAPELSRDCRTLYYIEQVALESGSGVNATLKMARR